MVCRNFGKYTQKNHNCTMEEMIRAFLEDGPVATTNTLQEWIYFNKKCSPSTVKTWFSHLSQYLKHRGVELNNEQLTFPMKIEEERHGLSLDEIRKILSVAGYGMKLRILTQLSSGMRRKEMLMLRKKHFHIGERVMIKIPAQLTKLKVARTTFISSECQDLLVPHLKKLSDNDLVFSLEGSQERNIGDSYETNLVRYLEKLNLDMRYESTGYHKINSHSFRAYFITKISRHDENIAKKLSGQKGYLLQYDRLTDEEKLEKYIEFEPDLFIFKQKPKSQEIQELIKKQEDLEQKLEGFEKDKAFDDEIARKGKEYEKEDPEMTTILNDILDKARVKFMNNLAARRMMSNQSKKDMQ